MHWIVYFLPALIVALVLMGISARKGRGVLAVAGLVVLVIGMFVWRGVLR